MGFGCYDAGSENCPCSMALTGDCVYCSRLSGKEICDCSWNGVCVYNEFMQNGEKCGDMRKEFQAPLCDIRKYSDDLYVIVVHTGRGFALRGTRQGSFIFIRRSESDVWYSTPLSCLYCNTDKGEIHVAVRIESVKTKDLVKEKESYIIRGVYRSGIINRLPQGRKYAAVTKGTGFAAAVSFIKENPECDVFIDTDKICPELVYDYMPLNFSGRIFYTDLNKNMEKLAEKLISYDGILAATSEYYSNCLKSSMKVPVTWVNTAVMCCGEGICGACMKDGVRVCKCSHIWYTQVEKGDGYEYSKEHCKFCNENC